MPEIKRKPIELRAGEAAPADVAAFDENHSIGDIIRYAIDQGGGGDAGFSEVKAILETLPPENRQ